VMVKGRWWARGELQARLDALAARWEEEFALDWDCGLPTDHAVPPAGDHAVFRMVGPISSTGGPYEWCARQFDVVVDGVAVDAGSQYVSVELVSPWAITVYAFGLPAEVSPGLEAYSYLVATFLRASFNAALDAGVPEVAADDVAFGEELVEVKTVGIDSLYRMCPRAARSAGAAGRFWICDAGNVDFAPGERLQLAGNVELTTDPAVLAAVFGSTACSCWRNQYEVLDCAEWEAAVPTPPEP